MTALSLWHEAQTWTGDGRLKSLVSHPSAMKLRKDGARAVLWVIYEGPSAFKRKHGPETGG
jgi:hypothetical protein